jgi:hypothetical protein
MHTGLVKNTTITAMLVAAFVAGSFIASPELRAYAANTVRSTDIVDGEVKTTDLANNAVTAGKIKDNEVKAAEIATDAVGAAEIQGVTKLVFGQCNLDNSEETLVYAAQTYSTVTCSINGVDSDDSAIATMSGANTCFNIFDATTAPDKVFVLIKNDCNSTSTAPGSARIAVIAYDK